MDKVTISKEQMSQEEFKALMDAIAEAIRNNLNDNPPCPIDKLGPGSNSAMAHYRK